MKVTLDNERLSRTLRRVFAERGIKQTVLASELGVSQGSIANVLKGKFKTDRGLVRRICEYVEINSDEFALDVRKIRLLSSEARLALKSACRGQKSREKLLTRMLRILEQL